MGHSDNLPVHIHGIFLSPLPPVQHRGALLLRALGQPQPLDVCCSFRSVASPWLAMHSYRK